MNIGSVARMVSYFFYLSTLCIMADCREMNENHIWGYEIYETKKVNNEKFD